MADVLVVEDSPEIRQMIAISLAADGFSVRQAADGAAALVALKARAPDCMVLDVMMPHLDGFGVLRRMRQVGLAPETRVVILTCRTTERDFLRGWELGADDYLTKPFDPTDLSAALRRLLASSSEELARRRGEELRKAEFLDRLETAFGRPPLPEWDQTSPGAAVAG